jgi:aerobic-type carbon monoxide dehydrogenase small subunit (CoxS/CutS family)
VSRVASAAAARPRWTAPVRLEVNGTWREVEVEPRLTLLDLLRENLDLTGAKRGCDRAECGCCTVLMDGAPIYACQTLAVQARGRRIVTVEGVGSTAALHPIQRAFVAEDGGQCGFCTPGFILAAKALLDRKPDPTDDEIRFALAGNLCRCNAYARIVAAVRAAADLLRTGPPRASSPSP